MHLDLKNAQEVIYTICLIEERTDLLNEMLLTSKIINLYKTSYVGCLLLHVLARTSQLI